jgi:hypothetical protein
MDYVSNLCSLGAMPHPRRSHLSFIAVILAAIVDVLFLLLSPTWHHVFVLIKEWGGRASKFHDRKENIFEPSESLALICSLNALYLVK